MSPGRNVGGASSYRRLLRFLRPYRWTFLASLALGVLAAGLEAFSLLLLIPFLRSLFGMGPPLPGGGRNAAERFIDGIAGGWLGPEAGLDGLRAVCVLVLAALLLKNLCVVGGRALSIRTQEFLVRDVRNAVHAHLQRLPLAFFERGKTGQLIARVIADAGEAKPVVTDALAQAVRQAATLAAYAVALFALSWRLALIAVILVPLVWLGLRPLLGRLRERFRRTWDDHGELVAALQESLGAVRLVKSRVAEEFEEKRFRRRSDGFSRRRIAAATTRHLASPLSETLASVVALGLVWIGASFVGSGGSIAPEQFVAFVTIALRAISPVKGFAQYPAIAAQGLAAADRFFEILDQDPEPAGGSRIATGPEREIRYENVSFAYEPGRAALSGVDLVIARGSVVAIVGPSGSGKSTLVDLLPRFADPQAGRVTIDGTDIREFSVDSLRRLTGLVGQEAVLFHDTVAANIAYGEDAPDRAAVEAAARTAGAHGFIEGLPDGYDTVLGDRGVRLSTGQRQRIGIARALFRDPPILILDEATSAVDAETETALRAAAAGFRGRTVIVVAHRLSTVREADRIFVLERGRLVDAGRHDALVSRGGPYRRLFGRQLERVSQP
ncbi:ABC transporter ATP-binding protein [Candidatus Palauibacter irciniicola]|uniref:ABC transporter ATP-binding protein n=1 Tax=Candidatus Palauibacter irciniicola TaxID=3056733 RepID=UPI003B012707